MLNIIWPAFIIISFIYALISGNIENVSNGIFDSASSAVELTLTFFRNNLLMEWNYCNSKTNYPNDKINKSIKAYY